MSMKPILFNTDMVRAILDGRKTCTRRIIKPPPQSRLCYTFAGCNCGTWGYPSKTAHEIWGAEYRYQKNITDEELKRMWNPPYHTDDILYVRETWKKAPNGYYYYEDWQKNYIADITKWHPSIHMPKEAARIWLKVMDVKVERLQEISGEDLIKEGIDLFQSNYVRVAFDEFKNIWNSTIKKSDLDRYGWDANPWVWVIEFERCEKPKEERGK